MENNETIFARGSDTRDDRERGGYVGADRNENDAKLPGSEKDDDRDGGDEDNGEEEE